MLGKDLLLRSWNSLNIVLLLQNGFLTCIGACVMFLCLLFTSGSHLPERDCHARVRLENKVFFEDCWIPGKGKHQGRKKPSLFHMVESPGLSWISWWWVWGNEGAYDEYSGENIAGCFWELAFLLGFCFCCSCHLFTCVLPEENAFKYIPCRGFQQLQHQS